MHKCTVYLKAWKKPVLWYFMYDKCFPEDDPEGSKRVHVELWIIKLCAFSLCLICLRRGILWNVFYRHLVWLFLSFFSVKDQATCVLVTLKVQMFPENMFRNVIYMYNLRMLQLQNFSKILSKCRCLVATNQQFSCRATLFYTTTRITIISCR
jgi:hypothetical protein